MRVFAIGIAVVMLAATPTRAADGQLQANRLLVEATTLAMQGDASENAGDRAAAYEGALARLRRIIDDHPDSHVAAALVTGQQIGTISLPLVRALAALSRMQATAANPAPAAGMAPAVNQALRAENEKLRASLAVERNQVTSLLMQQVRLRNAARRSPVAAATAAASPAAAETQDPEPEKTAGETTAETQEAAVTEQPEAQPKITAEDIAAALKEALQVGTERVVGQVGQVDGFNADPRIHIPLPETLAPVGEALKTIGLGSFTDDLEIRLNRAAETAAPKAKDIFWRAIVDMKLEDVEGVFRGPDDSATSYFRGAMSDPLAAALQPVIDESLAEAGAVKAYDDMMGKYKALPLVPDVKADLTAHVTAKAMDGLFLYLAAEEAAIRNDAARRTTELLKWVFENP